VAKYVKREIWVEETEVDLSSVEVMTIAQAARHLGVYTQAVSLALDRGDMTLIIDRKAPKRQGRRLVLRSEVEAWERKRARRKVQQTPTTRVTYSW
jgi:hypothetical protein